MPDKEFSTREMPHLDLNESKEVNSRETMTSRLDIQKVRHPIEIVTTDDTYCLTPTEEEFQWKVTAGKYLNEVVAVLGSCRQEDPTPSIIKNFIIAGLSMVLMRETGAKVLTSPVKSFKVLQPDAVDLKYAPGMILENRYRLAEMIGKGGAGTVFRAEHLRLNRSVAIKILETDDQQTAELKDQLLKRFEREINLLTRINHPYIANIIDQGTTDQTDPFMVMDYIEGVTLKRYIKMHHPLNYRQIQRLFRQIALAVFALHEIGILHRDLKPENIIVQILPGGEEMIRLLDFGIAKLLRGESEEQFVQQLTQAGMMMGTLDYMSPEQCQGMPVDARSDIYSLGVLLYEMITGSVPFSSTTQMGLLMKHVRDLPPPLQNKRADVPKALSAAVMQALEKRPSNRFPNPLGFINAVDLAFAELRNNTGPLELTGQGEEVAKVDEEIVNAKTIIGTPTPLANFNNEKENE